MFLETPKNTTLPPGGLDPHSSLRQTQESRLGSGLSQCHGPPGSGLIGERENTIADTGPSPLTKSKVLPDQFDHKLSLPQEYLHSCSLKILQTPYTKLEGTELQVILLGLEFYLKYLSCVLFAFS